MASKHKKKNKIRLYLDKPEDPQIQAEIKILSDRSSPIPWDRPHFLSRFIACTNVVCEGILSGQKDAEQEDVKTLFEKFYSDLWMTPIRNGIENEDHRAGIWMCLCKIKYILYLMMDESDNNKRKAPSHSGLCISSEAVVDYSMNTFIRSLNILVSKCNFLTYSKDIEVYLDDLFVCCSKFVSISSRDRRSTMNVAHLIATDGNDGYYTANRAFLELTEGTIRSLLCRIAYYNCVGKFKRQYEGNSYSQENINALYNWLLEFSQSVYQDIVIADLRREMYADYVYPGERELFMKHDLFIDPFPINIVAANRANTYDKISERLNKNPSSSLIEERKKFKSMDLPYNSEFNLLTIIIMGHYFNSHFDEARMSDFIIKRKFEERDEPISSSSNINTSVPKLVRAFNHYGLLYNDTLFEFDNFESCVLRWMEIIHTEYGGIPPIKRTERQSLNPLYDRIFHGKIEQHRYQQLEEELPEITNKLALSSTYLGIELPSNY